MPQRRISYHSEWAKSYRNNQRGRERLKTRCTFFFLSLLLYSHSVIFGKHSILEALKVNIEISLMLTHFFVNGSLFYSNLPKLTKKSCIEWGEFVTKIDKNALNKENPSYTLPTPQPCTCCIWLFCKWPQWQQILVLRQEYVD